MHTGIVRAIADDDEHFFVADPLLQMFEGNSYGIVQRGLAVGDDSAHRSFQLFRTVSE